MTFRELMNTEGRRFIDTLRAVMDHFRSCPTGGEIDTDADETTWPMCDVGKALDEDLSQVRAEFDETWEPL